MYKIDFHNHTEFSADCIELIEEVVREGIKNNLDEICLTEHLEIETGLSEKYVLNLDEYLKKARELREKYKEDIKILIGLEVGYSDFKSRDIEGLLDESDLDFVILSIHSIGNVNFLDNSFFRDKTKQVAYTKYFEKVLEGISSFKNYDVLGHLDFICRYGDYRDKSLEYKDYKEIIDKILEKLIKDNKGLEINTSGLRYGKSFYPSKEILLRYRELGGKRITIGSDSHKKEDVGYGFEEAVEILKSLGFKSYSIFKNRCEKIIEI